MQNEYNIFEGPRTLDQVHKQFRKKKYTKIMIDK